VATFSADEEPSPVTDLGGSDAKSESTYSLGQGLHETAIVTVRASGSFSRGTGHKKALRRGETSGVSNSWNTGLVRGGKVKDVDGGMPD